MSRTGDPGNPGMEIGEELAAVQMSPGPRFRMIEYRKPGSAFRAGKQNLWGMRHCHVHPFLIYIHRYRVNVPGGHNPQEILQNFFFYEACIFFHEKSLRLNKKNVPGRI